MVSNMSSIAGEAGQTIGEAGDTVAGGRCVGRLGVFPVPEAAAGALDAMSALAGIDIDALCTDERFGLLDALEAIERTVAGVNMKTLVAVDTCGETDISFGMTPPSYSDQHLGKDRRSWAGRLCVGKVLSSVMSDVLDAVVNGSLPTERAAVIASAVNHRNAVLMGGAQQDLIDLAASEPSFRDFARIVSELGDLLDPDGSHHDEPDTSKVTTGRNGDSSLAVNGTFCGVDSHTFEQLLDTATDRLWRQWNNDKALCPELVIPTRAELRAQALLELVRRGAGASPTSAGRTVVELSLIIDTDGISDADRLADDILAGTGIGRFTHPTYRQRHHLDHHHDGPCQPDTCGVTAKAPVCTPTGDPVQLTTSEWQLLTCDPHISEIVLDALGHPIATRDRDRHPNRAMRRSLNARDAGCAFPGCDHPPQWCDAHHIVTYSDDGKTITHNLVLLCRRHHGIVHRNGWQITPTTPTAPTAPDRPNHDSRAGPPPGLFTITTPGGHTLHTQHRRPPAPV